MEQESKRLKRRVRRSYFVSTVSIALVLFLLGSVGYLILNALNVTDKMKESVSVYVMLSDKSDETGREAVKTLIEAYPTVREVVYTSKEEAAEEYKEQTGEDFASFLEFNPLPDSFEVRLTAEGSQIDSIRVLESELLLLESVDEVVYQKGVIEQVSENINIFNMILLVFGLALLIISIILLNNTIRVSVLSKRHIISTMKLIGATRWFIMRPFVKTSILQGIYSALIASAMFLGLVYGLNRGLPEINFSMVQFEIVGIVSGMFLLGILISLIFTIFAVNRLIKMATDEIHLY